MPTGRHPRWPEPLAEQEFEDLYELDATSNVQADAVVDIAHLDPDEPKEPVWNLGSRPSTSMR